MLLTGPAPRRGLPGAPSTPPPGGKTRTDPTEKLLAFLDPDYKYPHHPDTSLHVHLSMVMREILFYLIGPGIQPVGVQRPYCLLENSIYLITYNIEMNITFKSFQIPRRPASSLHVASAREATVACIRCVCPAGSRSCGSVLHGQAT